MSLRHPISKTAYKKGLKALREAEADLAKARTEGLRLIAAAETPGRRILAREDAFGRYSEARRWAHTMRERMAAVEPSTELYPNLSPAAQKRMIERLEER